MYYSMTLGCHVSHNAIMPTLRWVDWQTVGQLPDPASRRQYLWRLTLRSTPDLQFLVRSLFFPGS